MSTADRVAFGRARRFLDYNPVGKWLALTSAVANALLHVALLIVLGVFVDLMVWRGQVPDYRDLLPAERAVFARQWRDLADKDGLLEGTDPVPRAALAADPRVLPAADQERVWRAYVGRVLDTLVNHRAAEVYLQDRTAVAESAATVDPIGRGILSLIVRTRDRLYAPVLGWLASWNPWAWESVAGARPNLGFLIGLLTLAAVLGGLMALSLFIMHDGAARATSEAASRLRRAVYHHSYRLGTLSVRALGPGEAASIFTRHMEAVHDGLYAWQTVAVRSPVKFGLLLAFALLVDVWLALASIVFALVLWSIGGQFAAAVRQQGRAATQRAAHQLALLQESLVMMRLVKVYLMELFNQARVERQLSEYVRSHRGRYRGEAVYRALLLFLGVMATLLLLFVAGLFVLNGSLGVASVLTLATALVCLYWPLVDWLQHRRVLRRGRESAAVLFRFLDRPGEVGQLVGAQFLPSLTHSLEFSDVSLAEPGTGRTLLQGVSLTIRAGQKVALIGPDDLEKHAFVYLIPRFLDPTSGEIRIDQHDVRWVTLASLRAQIALVLQHNLVFNDTVANNIGCGDPSYTLPQIIEAAKVAHAHQFIQKLPRGYDTPVGEMGHSLRVGEQFRIALARAILRDPSLLIVEEPATALDDDTKAMIDDTFDRILPGRTAIFLPHRLSTIRSCDTIYLLHNGKIEAQGDHRELLAGSELYRHLQYLEFNVFADQV